MEYDDVLLQFEYEIHTPKYLLINICRGGTSQIINNLTPLIEEFMQRYGWDVDEDEDGPELFEDLLWAYFDKYKMGYVAESSEWWDPWWKEELRLEMQSSVVRSLTERV